MIVPSAISRVDRRLRLGVCLLASVTLLAVAAAPVRAEPVKLRIGYDTIPLHIVPVILKMPELQKHNGKAYTVEFFRFRGSPLQVQALAGNQIDIAALAFSTLATSITTAKLNVKALQSNIDTLHKSGLLKQAINIAPHVDNSLVDEARKGL
ncbi:MAG: hypothetical protein GEU91_07115 [Rhizobiales bacterium]|nr:hypothetical protein [Hyphomicrobiales bacterium]